jgi:hypothetical protein
MVKNPSISSYENEAFFKKKKNSLYIRGGLEFSWIFNEVTKFQTYDFER